MRVFLDSSALAKRYVRELGSEAVAARCREAKEILLSVICVPEVLSGFNRLRREGLLSAHHYRHLKQEFAADIDQASVITLTPAVLRSTTQCLEAERLRAMDAIHVASAMESHCDLFLSADRQQCHAARQMLLSVDDLSGPAS